MEQPPYVKVSSQHGTLNKSSLSTVFYTRLKYTLPDGIELSSPTLFTASDFRANYSWWMKPLAWTKLDTWFIHRMSNLIRNLIDNTVFSAFSLIDQHYGRGPYVEEKE